MPALAAAAREIIVRNGFAETVSVHSVMSTSLDPAALGGRADLLVCEIVDDLLLGESVLTTVYQPPRCSHRCLGGPCGVAAAQKIRSTCAHLDQALALPHISGSLPSAAPCHLISPSNLRDDGTKPRAPSPEPRAPRLHCQVADALPSSERVAGG